MSLAQRHINMTAVIKEGIVSLSKHTECFESILDLFATAAQVKADVHNSTKHLFNENFDGMRLKNVSIWLGVMRTVSSKQRYGIAEVASHLGATSVPQENSSDSDLHKLHRGVLRSPESLMLRLQIYTVHKYRYM